MTRSTMFKVLGGALAFALITGPGTTAQECPKPGRQPATRQLMELVARDKGLRKSLTE